MIWIQFLATALVIVFAGVRLARYGDVLGERTGLGRSWVGVVLLAATTSLPELFTGFGATALAALPNIAIGDVLGSCMFNLLILSFMDAVQPEPLSTRAHQGHALSIGFGLVLIGIAGLGLIGSSRLPAIGWIGLYTPALIALYFVSMRLIFTHEKHRRIGEMKELHYADPAAHGGVHRKGPLLTAADASHGNVVLAVVTMNAAVSDRTHLSGDDQAFCCRVGHRCDGRCVCNRSEFGLLALRVTGVRIPVWGAAPSEAAFRAQELHRFLLNEA